MIAVTTRIEVSVISSDLLEQTEYKWQTLISIHQSNTHFEYLFECLYQGRKVSGDVFLLGLSILPCSTILILDFGVVPTVWYFGVVPTVWYFGVVPTVW